MNGFSKLATGSVIAAVLLTGCGSHSAQPTATSSSSATPTASATTPHTTFICGTPGPGVPPTPITPRTDGIYVGTEAGNHPIALRYYPNHEVYYGVGRTGTPTSEMAGWLNKAYSSANGNITGPWMYDASGAFSKPNTKGQLNKYSVWKYTGATLNLHIVSTFGCTVQGTVQENTTFMTFVPDKKS